MNLFLFYLWNLSIVDIQILKFGPFHFLSNDMSFRQHTFSFSFCA